MIEPSFIDAGIHHPTRGSNRAVAMADSPDRVDTLTGRGGPVRKSPLVVVAALLLGSVALSTPAVAADPVDVTVTILRVIEVQDPDPGFGQGFGDYFTQVRIGGFGFERSPNANLPDAFVCNGVRCPFAEPLWTFTRQVDRSAGNSVPIQIQLWDDDDFPALPDDVIDINPADGVQELSLNLDVSTGTWSGDVPANQGFAEGDGDTGNLQPGFSGIYDGGERGALMFDIALSADPDLDDDGIPDGMERSGIRDDNGNLVADLAALGANPCRKTIAVEADFMDGAPDGHTHRPQAAALTEAVNAFNNAPIPAVANCPYAGVSNASGVNLVVDVDDAIPEQATMNFGSGFETTRTARFNRWRRPYFHYSLWVHNLQANDSTSGLCCSDSGIDFLVSLGSWAGQTGTVRDQSGTFMHELGHALGLGHGGGDGVNFKPNYLSVMNYRFQTVGIGDTATGTQQIDYSRDDLDDLSETALREPAGINDATLLTAWFDPTFTTRAGVGNTALDWDWDTTIDANAVSVNLNADGLCIGAGPNNMLNTTPVGDDVVVGNQIRDGPNRTCNTSAAGDDTQEASVGDEQPNSLTGFDDWANIQFRAKFAPGAGAPPVTYNEELTFEQSQRIKAAWEDVLNPDLKVDKTVDRSDALPGDVLTYKVTVTNVGPGAAKNVSLTDTLPGGVSQSWTLPDLQPAESATRTVTYTVPFPIIDGTQLTNTASAVGENLLGRPEANTANNTANATTIVHTPTLQLGKTATGAVNAGEAINYTITYANTGSGNAADAVVTDTLPTGMTYTRRLDQGSGPPPDIVVRNPNGTTTLTWQVGSIAAASGPRTITYTARPSLLLSTGDMVANSATLAFRDANNNVYPSLMAAAATSIGVVSPSRDPRGLGYWRNHPTAWTAEILARIHATDGRFDGADASAPDGQLSPSEVAATLAPGGNMDKVLREQLLATYFNLATRRVNAATAIKSGTAHKLGLANVADAVLYARQTLTLPVSSATRARYSNATRILDEINNNVSPRY
jgi:uncharacterized repeat protein (TIGR01451 family)